MFPTCDACGAQERWHAQSHLVTDAWSGCVDEELVPLLSAMSDHRISVVRSCQDELHSGRVALLLSSSGDAQRFLDEVVRAAPAEVRRRVIEAACPPRIEDEEWSVATVVQPRFGPTHRVTAVEVQVDFPRRDLPAVVACLDGERVVETPAAEPRPAEPVDPAAVVASLIDDVLEIGDEGAFALLRLDGLGDEVLRLLVGAERWDAPSPGFYPGLRTVRPPLTTWLALRATVAALDFWDVDSDEADLDFHLDGARLAQRWCARSYALLTGEDLLDQPQLEDWAPASRSGLPRRPRPSYFGRSIGRALDTETSSPLELDERAVIDLLVRGAVAALDHEDELTMMAAAGEYPLGDPRRPVAPEPPQRVVEPWAVVHDVGRDGFVQVQAGETQMDVPVGNLRLLMEAAREVCNLPPGVPFACAVEHGLSGRPERIAFVPCSGDWHQISAGSLQAGDLLHEDVDYPYVVGQVMHSEDGLEVALERSGRGWLNLERSALVRAQRRRI